MQAIKSKLQNVKSFFISVFEWLERKCKKHKKKCIVIPITLAVLILLTGLIVGSFKSVNSTSQGVPINNSEGVVKDSTQSNYGSFVGLNTWYYSVPSHSYLVSFNSETYQKGMLNTFPSISARAIQGIKVMIDVDAKVKLVPTNLKIFLEDYGMNKVDSVHAGWQIYIKEKLRNVVVQSVASFKFYELSNKVLAAKITTQFTTYYANAQLNYPFIITPIGINIHYPKNTLELNNTLGIKLLKQTSKLQQLNTQLSLLNSYITTYQSHIDNYTRKRATIDGMIASRQQSIKMASSGWIQGLQILNRALGNQTLLQKYLETYFNNLYNVTYRLDTIYPFVL